MINLRSKDVNKGRLVKAIILDIIKKGHGEIRKLANKLEGLFAKSHLFSLHYLPKKNSLIKVNDSYYYIVDEFAYIKFNSETGGFIGYFFNVDEYDMEGNFVGTDKKYVYEYELVEDVVLDIDFFFKQLRSQK